MPPQRLPDSPFPRKISPKPYKNPGTPYRKVDPPHSVPRPDLDKTGDCFEGTESDSEGERTFTAEPKVTPKHKPAEHKVTTKHKPDPIIILPFYPDPDEKPKSPDNLPVRPPPSGVVTPDTTPPAIVTPEDHQPHLLLVPLLKVL